MLTLNLDCKDFISKLLVTNPKKRAKLSQLLDHSWLTESITFLEPMEEKVQNFRPSVEEMMDVKVVEIMEQMGLEKKTIIQSVITGKFNQAAGLYFLLTHHKLYGNEDIRLSSMVLSSINKETDVPVKEAADISDELAQVLFQVERTRAPKAIEKARSVPASEAKTLRSKAVTRPLSSTNTQVVPLPPVAGATLLTDTRLKAIHAKVNIAQPKAGGKRDSTSTKFGLTNHSGKETKIPVDESLYYMEERGTGPRTIKFAFNCFSHNTLQPELFFERVFAILDKNDVQYHNDEYLCACEWGDIKFELEICRIPRQAACGLRIKRISGDIWDFKKLSTKLRSDLDENLL